MKGKKRWDERPHTNPHGDPTAITICRLAPTETAVCVEWLDGKQDGKYILSWRPMFTAEGWTNCEVVGYEAVIDHLTPWRDYEICIARISGEKSRKRIFRTAPVPGTVINYLHPHDTQYAFSGRALCSPSLVRLPSGKLLASMDVYEGRGVQTLSLLFSSDDRGETWHYVCDLYPLFWGKLFWHRDRLYMLGLSTEFGDVVIGASDDEGQTWTAPIHLFAGSNTLGEGWEQSPMPVVVHNGRLYVSMEYAGRNIGRAPCVLSAAEEECLLNPENWHASKPYTVDPTILGKAGTRVECFIEGNLFVSPDGDLRCMLRCDGEGFDVLDGKAPVLRVNESDPDAPMEFLEFISLPCGYGNKFMMQYDAVSGYYIAIGNLPTDPNCSQQRNIVALFCSKDSVHWTTCCRLFDYENEPANEVGLQYPSFLFDGDDILLQLRTALNGARNHHDANYSTFHVIKDFRRLLRSADFDLNKE